MVTDEKEIYKLVNSTWRDKESQEFFSSLVQVMEMDDQPGVEPPITVAEIIAFINSMRITVIKLIVHAPIPNPPPNGPTTKPTLRPRFNIYADSSHIRDVVIWKQIRFFLADRTYQTSAIDGGRTYIAPHNCGICHGVDHPRRLCPFPSLPGWKGPKCQTDKRGRPDSDNTSYFPRAKKPRFQGRNMPI